MRYWPISIAKQGPVSILAGAESVPKDTKPKGFPT
jgi:hypothetical protein